MMEITAKVVMKGVKNTERLEEPNDYRATIRINNMGFISATSAINRNSIPHNIETLVNIKIVEAEYYIKSFTPGTTFCYGDNYCLGHGKIVGIKNIILEDDFFDSCNMDQIENILDILNSMPNVRIIYNF